MKKFIIILIAILFFTIPSDILSNPISWPYLPASDYFRGTAGERLFFGFRDYKKGSFFINNDFRYYDFKHYWSESGKEQGFDHYSRMINIIAFNYIPFDRIQLSIRIPIVKVKNYKLSNSGLSDIFFGFSYKVAKLMNNNLQVSLSTGVKIPTGYYEYSENKIPIGTGSYDVPIILNADFCFNDISCNLDIGYILMGNSKVLYPEYNREKIINNEDEFFIDFAVIKNLNDHIALKFESNYYDVFTSTGYGQNKLSITPGILISTFSDKLKFDLGIACDLVGKNTFYGFSPVLRIHYNIL